MRNGEIAQGRFADARNLGQSSSIITWMALDRKENRACVVKHLRIEESDLTFDALKRRAGILADLRHPNIPDTYDCIFEGGDDPDEIWIAQEYIEGRTLARLVSEGHHFTEAEIFNILSSITSALAYIHAFSPRLIHRNIRPDHILIRKEGTPYLTGFGEMLDDADGPARLPDAVMKEGFGYLPVEVMAEETSPSSDIYGLGVTLIFALSHQEPMQMMRGAENRLDFDGRVNVSPDLLRILKKMVAADPKERYPNADAVLADIAALQGVGELTAAQIAEKGAVVTMSQKTRINKVLMLSLLGVGVVSGAGLLLLILLML